MTKINVYSKLRTSIEFRLYKNEQGKDKDGVNIALSQVLNKVVIDGVTRYLHNSGRKITLLIQLAKTEVEKDLWDAIMQQNAVGNVHLRKKQIFTAKSDAEAYAMAKDVSASISDMMTPEDLKKKKAEGPRLM